MIFSHRLFTVHGHSGADNSEGLFVTGFDRVFHLCNL